MQRNKLKPETSIPNLDLRIVQVQTRNPKQDPSLDITPHKLFRFQVYDQARQGSAWRFPPEYKIYV